MQDYIRTTSAFAALLIASLGAGTGQAQTGDDEAVAETTPAGSALPWPNQFDQGDTTFTVYPPQLDRWQGDRLEGRAAVAVQPAGAAKPVFGVVSLSARTEVDNAAGTVTVRQIAVTRASFPTATDRAGVYLDAVRHHLAAVTWTVALNRLQSDLAIDRAAQQTQSQPLRNDPPRILYTQTPTILVPVDGQPVLREMMGLALMRVLNTRALILLDKPTGRYFLFVAGRWMEAPSIDGPWAEAQVRPTALDEAKEQAVASGQVDLLEGSEPANGRAPSVILSTVPAELVQTDGPPEYSPIERTQLLYVTNSPNRLFLDLPTQQHYVLLAGRWYRTSSLQQGAWYYVPGASLPVDFAMIPDSHATESVRASVPGTPQAQEAAIANSVPQVAMVKRSAAKLEITYDGPPQFRPIEGTSLESAVNAPVPVIRVDWRNFYALDNGVWFFSESPDGPWTAATFVPPVVYTIPHSSPLHYVTYVRVYDTTPEDVYVGYTPGYVGSYVTNESTVVYGTGWYYRPWIGTVWYGPPVTWGFGFSYWNTWWNPWPWSPVWVAWRPFPCFHPWWGPWSSRVVVVRPVGGVGHTAIASPFATGAPGGRRVAVNNINANTANVTNIYRRWGPRVVGANPVGTRSSAQAAVQPAGPGAALGAGRPTRGGSDNPDWHIYRQRNGQWQRFVGNGQWDNAQQPSPNARQWVKPQAGALAVAPSPSATASSGGLARPGSGLPTGTSPAARPHGAQAPTRLTPWQGEPRRGSMAPANPVVQPSAGAAPPVPRVMQHEPGPLHGPAAVPAVASRQWQPGAGFDRPAMSDPAVVNGPRGSAPMAGPGRNSPHGLWHRNGDGARMR